MTTRALDTRVAESALERHSIPSSDNLLSNTDEGNEVAKVHSVSLEAGETWSLIDDKWWQQWIRYTGFDPSNGNVIHARAIGPRPGPIDNTRLGDPSAPGAISHDLEENRDYVLVIKQVADLLYSWYGGGPVYERPVIALGLTRSAKVELFPSFIIQMQADENGEPKEESARLAPVSGKYTFDMLRKQAQIALGSSERSSSGLEPESKNDDPDTVRVWLEVIDSSLTTTPSSPVFAAKSHALEADELDALSLAASGDPSSSSSSSSSLQTEWRLLHGDELKAPIEGFRLPHGTKVLFEQRSEDGSWPRKIATRDLLDFRVGDVVDTCDKFGQWYEGTIRYVKEGSVQIHFNGFNSNWDETIPRSDSHRFAAKGTRSKSRSSTSSSSSAISSYHGYGSYGSSYGSGSSYSSSYYSSWGSSSEGSPRVPGAVGLSNLGNTCFMNSILSCLNHTPILTNYFIDDAYIRDINRDNPIGWQGKVADEYGALVKEYWSGKYTTVAPRKFKDTIGEFKPQFSGYQQHDSQELLAFLLDGLHEDLNLVRKKPPTTPVESNNRPDPVVAAEAWSTHLARNRSVVIDNLVGQLKSRVTCPTESCKKVSITFDPYMFLTVPLPLQTDMVQTVHFVPSDPSQPITVYGCTVSKFGRIMDLKNAISAFTGISTKRIVVGDMWNYKIYKFFEEDASLGDIRPSDLVYAFDVPSLEQYKPGEAVCIQLVHQKIERDPHWNPKYTPAEKKFTASAMGTPLVIALPCKASTTVGDVRNIIIAAVQRTVRSSPSGPVFEPASNGKEEGVPSESPKPSVSSPGLDNDDGIMVENPSDDEGVVVDAPGGPGTLSMNDSFDQQRSLAPDVDGADSQLVVDGANQLPYRIVQLDNDCRTCSSCGYSRPCLGCPLPENDNEDFQVKMESRFYYSAPNEKEAKVAFGIQWLNLEYFDSNKSAPTVKHESAQGINGDGEAVDSVVSLDECINLHNKEETLTDDNQWYCSNCKEHKNANKKLDVWTLPNILIVHLKRFQYTRMWREKISTLVDFPIEGLDMSKYTPNPEFKGENALYDLYAVSNHYGGLGGGHYTAYVKNLATGDWYQHDDSRVSSVDVKEIKSSSAYVLFYRRRDIAPQTNPATPRQKHREPLQRELSAEQKAQEYDEDLD